MSKPFWRSKTLWALVGGIALVLGQYIQGVAWLPPEAQAVLGFLGVTVLRFVTAQGIIIPGVTDRPKLP